MPKAIKDRVIKDRADGSYLHSRLEATLDGSCWGREQSQATRLTLRQASRRPAAPPARRGHPDARRARWSQRRARWLSATT